MVSARGWDEVVGNMREWDQLVETIRAMSTPDDSLRELLRVIADKIDAQSDFSEVSDDSPVPDELSDLAWAIRHKTQDLIEAVLRKPPPPVIVLPELSNGR